MCQAVDIVVASGDMMTPIMKQVLDDNISSQGVNDILLHSLYVSWVYISSVFIWELEDADTVRNKHVIGVNWQSVNGQWVAPWIVLAIIITLLIGNLVNFYSMASTDLIMIYGWDNVFQEKWTLPSEVCVIAVLNPHYIYVTGYRPVTMCTWHEKSHFCVFFKLDKTQFMWLWIKSGFLDISQVFKIIL